MVYFTIGPKILNFSMIGKLKIRDEDYHYEINEMNEIFVTESEYRTVEHHFAIEKSYFVNPKLLLANLDYLQKGKNFKTNRNFTLKLFFYRRLPDDTRNTNPEKN